MQILAFDSSALTATVALWRDHAILAELSSTDKLNHSVKLLPMIDEVFRMAHTSIAETDAFAISAGPGSFTGVRIGISTLKGLAFGSEKLCAPVSTLEALAFNECGTAGIICAVMDARRGEFYNALFRCDETGALVRLTEDRAISAEALFEQLSAYRLPVVVCGDGAVVFYKLCKSFANSDFLRLSLPHRRVQRASSVACIGAAMLEAGQGVVASRLAPLYLRASGAERKREKSEE